MIIFLTSILLVSANSLYKRHVSNSVVPTENMFQSYNVKNWVEYLNLQQIVIVDIGESYCAIFVEFHPHNSSTIIQEYFLGICDRETIFKWKLCSAEVERRRPNDCLFDENANIAARVHRRLCDLTSLLHYGSHCNCSNTLLDSSLFDIEGFPTCFQAPLPDSICTISNVCGITKCLADEVSGRIYTVICDQECLGQQPFCETMDYETTIPSEVISFWSDWSDPICIDPSCDILLTEAICINKYTGLGDIDCLGPGTNCCPPEQQYCKCRIVLESSTLRIMKTFQSSQNYWKRTKYLDYIDLNTKDKQLGTMKFSKFKRSVKRSTEYIEDDDEDDDMGDEDIAIEEYEEETEGFVKVTTTELPERDELKTSFTKPSHSIHSNQSEFDEYGESSCNTIIVQYCWIPCQFIILVEFKLFTL